MKMFFGASKLYRIVAIDARGIGPEIKICGAVVNRALAQLAAAGVEIPTAATFVRTEDRICIGPV